MIRQITSLLLVTLSSLFISTLAAAEEPALPSGLGDEPMLPSGRNSTDLPELPMGISENTADDRDVEDTAWEEDKTWQINGFWEARWGEWTHAQTFLSRHPLAENRVQLSVERAFDKVTLNVSGDLLYDKTVAFEKPDLESGNGWLDLRVANLVFSPSPFMDIRLGRQILTWGMGDLIFINDLFPKDWNAFLIGRESSYLKAPSDAIKISLFSKQANLDIVYTPRFDSDRYINGERAAYFNANLGRIAGTDAVIRTEKPDRWLNDQEIAIRLYRNFSAFEFALYGYEGYWKSPGGFNADTGNAVFPGLRVYGASFRGPWLKGIVSGEWGYYYSKDDTNGSKPFINNSEQRLLLTYEQELVSNLTLALQVYSVRMLNYSRYRKNLPEGIPSAQEDRHELSMRLTWLTINQKLNTSLFIRYSPSDKDIYLRPKLRYSLDDHWSYEVGGNIFYGTESYTFFGQFDKNDNIYAAIRYGL